MKISCIDSSSQLLLLEVIKYSQSKLQNCVCTKKKKKKVCVHHDALAFSSRMKKEKKLKPPKPKLTSDFSQDERFLPHPISSSSSSVIFLGSLTAVPSPAQA